MHIIQRVIEETIYSGAIISQKPTKTLGHVNLHPTVLGDLSLDRDRK